MAEHASLLSSTALSLSSLTHTHTQNLSLSPSLPPSLRQWIKNVCPLLADKNAEVRKAASEAINCVFHRVDNSLVAIYAQGADDVREECVCVCVCVCLSFVTPQETNIIDLWVSPLNLGGLKDHACCCL
jgi:hypothetical protein